MKKIMMVLMSLCFSGSAGAASLLTIGDSITQGIMPGGGISFSTHLAANHDVVNGGCGGATVGNWHPFAGPVAFCAGTFVGADPNLFAVRVVPNVPVNYAIVMLGTVDTAWMTTPAVYATQLDFLTGALLDFGAEHVVLMTPPPWPIFAGGSAAKTALLQGYRAEVLNICNARPGTTSCIDIYGILEPNVQFFFSPGDVHPNFLAHQVIANEIETRLVPEPGSATLLVSGLLGLGALHHRRKRRS